MNGMHEDEIAISDDTVRRLVAAQLPEWVSLPVRRLPPYSPVSVPAPLALGEPGQGYPWHWTEGRGGPLTALDDWVRTWTARADTTEVDPDAVLAVWDDALDAPARDGEPCWFHGDLHEGNLLVRDGRLAAVIDWGAAGRGDPAIELNAMWATSQSRRRRPTGRRSGWTGRPTAAPAASRWRPRSARGPTTARRTRLCRR